jgi:hypothetical protein
MLSPVPWCIGGNMVNYVTKKRETKHERGGLCLDEEEARYYFVRALSSWMCLVGVLLGSLVAAIGQPALTAREWHMQGSSSAAG